MPNSDELPPLSEAQLEIMNLIWDLKSCSVGDVWKELNARRGVSRNTIHTLIIRLEEKGWLTHSEDSDVFKYSATVSREETQQRSLQRMIETVFDGSAEGLVLTLLNGGTVSKSEAERIREMITRARKRKS